MDWKQTQPKDSSFLFYLGDDATSRQDYSSAAKHYAEFVKLQPNNAVGYNNLAFATASSNRDAAIGYAKKALSLEPNEPEFMDTLSTLLSERGDHKEAIELQTKARSLRPQNRAYDLSLAKIYIKADKKELAKKELEELSKLGEKFSKHAEVMRLLKSL